MSKNYSKSLSSGDIVDIIAPAKGAYSDILKAVEFLKALGLTPRVDSKDQVVTEIRDILFANKNEVSFIDFNFLNDNSKKQQTIEATITGVNLCLIETSIGTSWQ